MLFDRLGEAEIEHIVVLQVDILRNRLAERSLGLELTPSALAYLAKTGYDPDFGARPLKRLIQREVADPVALGLLKGDYSAGDVVAIDATSDGGLMFSRRSLLSAPANDGSA